MRLARDDNRNSHRAETEYGLRRKGYPSEDEGGGPRPRAPEALAPVLQTMLGSFLSRITHRVMRAEPFSCLAPNLNQRQRRFSARGIDLAPGC